jgi:predicted Zn-dependent protease
MDIEENFVALTNTLLNHLCTGEDLTLSLSAESSQFTRFNQAKVRQTGTVNDATLTLTLMWEQREIFSSFSLTGDRATDITTALNQLEDLREQIPQLPINPYLVLPANLGSSHEVHQGKLLSPDEVIEAILQPIQDQDMAGIYSGGQIIRANANSAGQRHWFSTENFVWDYSLFTTADDGTPRSVKGIYANSEWYQDEYSAQIDRSLQQLQALNRPIKSIPRGEYRTYFAPYAVAEIVSLLTWSVGIASLRQGSSALLKLYKGEESLSPQIHLREDFRLGNVPRFNNLGEVAPLCLDIISNGRWANALVNAQSAKEYGQTANGAGSSETMRSPVLAEGDLQPSAVLTELDRGLYLGNLHYLNWSDRVQGKITGMTRYACFWVENGELWAPIDNLRFDDSIYKFWGRNLEALTSSCEFIPNTDTYGQRSLGGISVPGCLTKSFTFTL